MAGRDAPRGGERVGRNAFVALWSSRQMEPETLSFWSAYMFRAFVPAFLAQPLF